MAFRSLYPQARGRGPATERWAGGPGIAPAEALAVQAAVHGDTTALWILAWRRQRAGDSAGAEALYRQAADRGDPFALRALAMLREQAGDTVGARRLRRFGLTGDR